MDITTNLLNDWANRVRDFYLKDSVDPSERVRTIVEENDLNYKQAQRLCEATNLSIKRALRKSTGPDDVQFPLASITEVINTNDGIGEVEKEASLRPESFLDKYAKYFYEGRNFKKEASLALTCDKLAMVVESLDRRTKRAHRDVSLGEHEFKKIANRILDYIKDEARATGSVDESYTVLSRLMPKHAELIDGLYKFAQRVLEVDMMGVNIKETELMKNANWVPNPDSGIAKLFEKYADFHQQVQQARTRYAGCQKAGRDAEAQLRQMILNGE